MVEDYTVEQTEDPNVVFVEPKEQPTYLWTFTSQYIHDSSEEVNEYPTWLVWDSEYKMRDHIIQSLWDDMTFLFGRGLSDKELISIRDQVHEFINKDIKVSRENELKITLDNHGEEEEYYVVRVWTMTLIK